MARKMVAACDLCGSIEGVSKWELKPVPTRKRATDLCELCAAPLRRLVSLLDNQADRASALNGGVPDAMRTPQRWPTWARGEGLSLRGIRDQDLPRYL